MSDKKTIETEYQALWDRAGKFLGETRDFAKALACYEKILSEYHDVCDPGRTHYLIGASNLSLHQFDRALVHLEKAQELIDPTEDGNWYWAVLWRLGETHYQTESYAKALEYLDEAENYVRCLPDSPEIELGYYRLQKGDVYYYLDRNQEALEQLRIARGLFEELSGDDGDVTAVNLRMAQVYEDMKEYETAVMFLEKIDVRLLEGGAISQYYCSVVCSAIQVEQYQKVIEAFTEIDKLGIHAQDASLIYYAGALAYYAMERLPEAERLVKKCHEFPPDPDWVEEQSKELLDLIQKQKRKYS